MAGPAGNVISRASYSNHEMLAAEKRENAPVYSSSTLSRRDVYGEMIWYTCSRTTVIRQARNLGLSIMLLSCWTMHHAIHGQKLLWKHNLFYCKTADMYHPWPAKALVTKNLPPGHGRHAGCHTEMHDCMKTDQQSGIAAKDQNKQQRCALRRNVCSSTVP